MLLYTAFALLFLGSFCSCCLRREETETANIEREPQPLEITLDVYSGVKNPSWLIQPTDAEYSDVVRLAKQTSSDMGTNSILGYRGCILKGADLEGLQFIWARTNILVETRLLRTGVRPGRSRSNNFIISRVLCDLEPGNCEAAGSTNDTATELSTSTEERVAQKASSRKPCVFRCKQPKYFPAKWNTKKEIQYFNNCYNYGTNTITGTYAQPGRAGGEIYTDLTAAAVLEAATRDGLEDLGNPGPGQFPQSKNCLVALVVWLDVDFHWYRQDKNGLWSHKMGGTPATDRDNSGNIITDPRTCDSGSYEFVTFMSYCPKGIEII